MSPRAAYIHVPFCTHRCGYCNFTLVAGRDDLIGSYLEALERELATIEQRTACLTGEIDTLFFGGGTPTHLSPEELDRLLRMTLATFPLAEDGEFSVEANPTDLSIARAEVLKRHGVTRISLGAQSFDSAKLKVLERDHQAHDIEAAVEVARQFGFQVSIDLIFAAPNETLCVWKADLEAALRLSPDHVSVYGLTIERGSAFYARREHGQLKPLGEELERAMYLAAIDRLTAAQFEHYEVSNFARPGFRSRHNEVYWTGKSYHAAGPGAARFIDGRREMNHRSTTTYIARMLSDKSPVAETEKLAANDAAMERLVFALRRLEGIDLGAFAEETGHDVHLLVGPKLESHLAAGRLRLQGDRLQLTREGLLVSDAIWTDFLQV